MKRNLLRRIPAVVLTVALLLTSVFSISMFASAASFTPRLSAPSSSNKYYYSNTNVFYKYGYGMPNCTAYAWGRAYEILGTEPKLSWNDAGQWYDYNKNGGYYKYGSTPKVGAVACWNYSGGGHVAVVEKIENGKMTLSNSEWGGRSFYLTYANTTDTNPGGNSWWSFQGYIYLIDSADPVQPNKPESYKTGVYRTNVDDALNMRSGAGTSYSLVASVPNAVKLNVTKVQASGGYNWGYTSYNGKNGWVALEYCEYISELPKETDAPTTVKPTQAPTTAPTTAVSTTYPTEAATTIPATKSTDSDKDFSKGLGVGDVNGDGAINVVDATQIQKYVAGFDGFTEEQIKWCDFDFSGEVTITDATGLQRFLAQKYD